MKGEDVCQSELYEEVSQALGGLQGETVQFRTKLRIATPTAPRMTRINLVSRLAASVLIRSTSFRMASRVLSILVSMTLVSSLDCRDLYP